MDFQFYSFLWLQLISVELCDIRDGEYALLCKALDVRSPSQDPLFIIFRTVKFWHAIKWCRAFEFTIIYYALSQQQLPLITGNRGLLTSTYSLITNTNKNKLKWNLLSANVRLKTTRVCTRDNGSENFSSFFICDKFFISPYSSSCLTFHWLFECIITLCSQGEKLNRKGRKCFSWLVDGDKRRGTISGQARNWIQTEIKRMKFLWKSSEKDDCFAQWWEFCSSQHTRPDWKVSSGRLRRRRKFFSTFKLNGKRGREKYELRNFPWRKLRSITFLFFMMKAFSIHFYCPQTLSAGDDSMI